MSNRTGRNERQRTLATVKARLETAHAGEGNFADPWDCPLARSLSDCGDGPVLIEPAVHHTFGAWDPRAFAEMTAEDLAAAGVPPADAVRIAGGTDGELAAVPVRLRFSEPAMEFLSGDRQAPFGFEAEIVLDLDEIGIGD